MKKLFQIGALCLGLLMAQAGFAADAPPAPPAAPSNMHNSGDVIQDGSCPVDGPCGDQRTGDCWCRFVHYQPCYYTTQRCVEEQVPCQKRCCRMVPKYCEVQKCRYVPQYYCETICKQEPEYYCTTEYKCCKKWVCDRHCKYVPTYYWKHLCGDQGKCGRPCPSESPCPSN
jgi:hypothetical protein